MKTISINLYEFNELSEKAKENALNELRCINLEHNWWNFTYDDAKEIGLKLTGFELDRNSHAEGEFLLCEPEVAQNILNSHSENCETYKIAENFLSKHDPIFADYMNADSTNYESNLLEYEMQEICDVFLNDLLKAYAVMLQNEYEYLQTDEDVIDTIEANGYYFTKCGTLSNN